MHNVACLLEAVLTKACQERNNLLKKLANSMRCHAFVKIITKEVINYKYRHYYATYLEETEVLIVKMVASPFNNKEIEDLKVHDQMVNH